MMSLSFPVRRRLPGHSRSLAQRRKDTRPEEARTEVMDFLYADIYEAGMSERVKASDEAAKAYYAEQDAEKLKEMIK